MNRQGHGYRQGQAGPWPKLALFFALLALATSVLAFWALWQLRSSDKAGWEEIVESPEIPEPAPKEDLRVLVATGFDTLPGWESDDLSQALPPFRASCQRFRRRGAEASVRPLEVGGLTGDWARACQLASQVPAERAAARAFFEAEFRPFQILNNDQPEGLFTGYYEATLRGSRNRQGPYTYPLYRRPKELVAVDLGHFREDLKGRRLAGTVKGGRLHPFSDRAAIDAGAMAGRGLELVWVDDPIDAFFLHIQGSGRVELAQGGHLRVGYADQNGHPYFAIGRDLVERGALSLEEVSMQSIREWLAGHPEEAASVLEKNPSYIFFRELVESGPVGSQGAVLTPRRSLAVDRKFLPLGAPLWLDARAPAPNPQLPDETLRQLMIAQDTGGAIRGPVRGDVFWGHGEEATERAGRMKHRGQLWLLLPHSVAERHSFPETSTDG